MYTELNEVFMPFNTKELDNFNEATANCTREEQVAIAKRISTERLPEGWQFTQSQIKRFVTEESLKNVRYPGIKITSGTADAEQLDDQKIAALRER